jgi:hypothetical protein
MTERWIGPDNGDGNIIDFGMTKAEKENYDEHKSREINIACDQLSVISEITTVFTTEVCEALGIDAYPLNRALEALRTESDLVILKLEKHL